MESWFSTVKHELGEHFGSAGHVITPCGSNFHTDELISASGCPDRPESTLLDPPVTANIG